MKESERQEVIKITETIHMIVDIITKEMSNLNIDYAIILDVEDLCGLTGTIKPARLSEILEETIKEIKKIQQNENETQH